MFGWKTQRPARNRALDQYKDSLKKPKKLVKKGSDSVIDDRAPRDAHSQYTDPFFHPTAHDHIADMYSGVAGVRRKKRGTSFVDMWSL